MNDKIRNLGLVLRDKMKFTVTESESPYSILGTQEVRYYDSELGKVNLYKLMDKRENSEEFYNQIKRS